MAGYTLAQPFGFGRTEQSTIYAGQSPDYPAPVAGQAYAIHLQRYDRWRLIAATFTLTTDSTAGNRYTTIEYLAANGNSAIADGAAVLVAPSTTAARFLGSLYHTPGEWNVGTDVFFPLSGLWLEAGRRVTINVANMGATDILSKVALTFDRTLVDDDGSAAIRERELAQRLEAAERG